MAAPRGGASAGAGAGEKLADRDDDGVPDVCDWCPGEPGINRGDHFYGRGCPFVDAFHSEGDAIRALSVALGASGAWRVFDANGVYRYGAAPAPSKLPRPIDHVAHAMNGAAGLRFFVIGHAAPNEPDPEAAARRRAQAVVEALVAAGVPRNRLLERSAGAMHPVYASGGIVDSAASRRVTFDVDRDRMHRRAWNKQTREVDYVPRGELPSCPSWWLAKAM